MRQTSIYGKLLAMAGCAALVCAVGVGTGHAASVTAEATGQVIKPIGVVVGTNLEFGRFMSGATAGTIEVTAAGIAQVTGGVGAIPGNIPVAATFNVSGEASTGFSISMPNTVTLTNTDGAGAETMVVTLAKDAVAAAGTGTLDGLGALAVKVAGPWQLRRARFPGTTRTRQILRWLSTTTSEGKRSSRARGAARPVPLLLRSRFPR